MNEVSEYDAPGDLLTLGMLCRWLSIPKDPGSYRNPLVMPTHVFHAGNLILWPAPQRSLGSDITGEYKPLDSRRHQCRVARLLAKSVKR
jgi:hypothetical protein